MKRKIPVLALAALLLALTFPAEAQQPTKIPRIGYLTAAFPERIEAFRQGLRELGYVEGKSVVIEYRYAQGKIDRLPALAAELVRSKVDVIVAPSTPAIHAAKQATNTIPIVFPSAGDPVAYGFVDSLARPGGNLTGLTNGGPELSGKRLELLKEAFPRISRVAVLRDPRQPPQSFKETQVAGQHLGLRIQSLEIQNAADVETAFSEISTKWGDALIALPHSVINAHQKRIVELTAKNRLPTMYPSVEFVNAGGLMSYSPIYSDQYRRAAYYVDKILKGAKPADLPVEQPTKFELLINLKTANALGLTIPPSVLYRADKIIK